MLIYGVILLILGISGPTFAMQKREQVWAFQAWEKEKAELENQWFEELNSAYYDNKLSLEHLEIILGQADQFCSKTQDLFDTLNPPIPSRHDHQTMAYSEGIESMEGFMPNDNSTSHDFFSLQDKGDPPLTFSTSENIRSFLAHPHCPYQSLYKFFEDRGYSPPSSSSLKMLIECYNQAKKCHSSIIQFIEFIRFSEKFALEIENILSNKNSIDIIEFGKTYGEFCKKELFFL